MSETFPIVFENPSVPGVFIEFGPVITERDGTCSALHSLGDVPPEDEDLVSWTIWARKRGGEVACVGDFISREGCEEMLGLLFGDVWQ